MTDSYALPLTFRWSSPSSARLHCGVPADPRPRGADGPQWAFEIKHDGFPVICRREGDRVRVFSRRGNDWADWVPAIVSSLAKLRVRSITLDGEAVVCGPNGVSDFELLRAAVGRKGSREATASSAQLLRVCASGSRIMARSWRVPRRLVLRWRTSSRRLTGDRWAQEFNAEYQRRRRAAAMAGRKFMNYSEVRGVCVRLWLPRRRGSQWATCYGPSLRRESSRFFPGERGILGPMTKIMNFPKPGTGRCARRCGSHASRPPSGSNPEPSAGAHVKTSLQDDCQQL